MLWIRARSSDPPASCRAAAAWLGLAGLLAVVVAPAVRAADFAEADELLRRGEYAACVAMAEAMIGERPWSLGWPLYLVRGLSTLGRYEEAQEAVDRALAADSRSTQLRWLAVDVYRHRNRPDRAERMIDEIIQLTADRPWAYRNAPDLVVFGRAALSRGADPKEVLERIYGAARRSDPQHPEAWIASAELALEKGDYELAARTCREALEKIHDHPDLHYLLARAYGPSEPALSRVALEKALEINPRHIPSLLALAERAIDAERYDRAATLLGRVRAINPYHQEAWAFEAVLAELENDPAGVQAALEMARKTWPGNPWVPWLLGRKLSEKYRFREGAQWQREALRLDTAFLPARLQLAQDLLRLGQEEEGWQLAEEVHQADGYSVLALNLLNLHEVLRGFTAVTNAHFVLRMTPQEAAVYGKRALALLERAHREITGRYGLAPAEPVLVEIFQDQKDFAVRTFGMPENHGFLGVCFGRVITANSPVSRPGHAFNWESMLWHEFVHVVTLQLTRHRMPRWLSEGISVYEERQADPTWGERMDPEYRRMILGEELTPIRQLSAAFLSPRSEKHLQFAYYESSLVVEYLVERFGFETLRRILLDLAEGRQIHAALETHTQPLEQLEPAFAAWARARAEALAPGLDWDEPTGLSAGQLDEDLLWELWERTRPNNIHVLRRQARHHIEAQEWSQARTVLERLVKSFPEDRGAGSAWRQLALCCRALGDTESERRAWETLLALDDEAADACLRLMELGAQAGDWELVRRSAERHLAINPMIPTPHRYLARAAEELGDARAAAEAWRALLALGPENPALAHYRLALQLHRLGDPAARRHVLAALEDAPRFQAALELLLELHDAEDRTSAAAPSPGS